MGGLWKGCIQSGTLAPGLIHIMKGWFIKVSLKWGSVESAVAINLRSIFWCKIIPARGMSLTGMVGYQP